MNIDQALIELCRKHGTTQARFTSARHAKALARFTLPAALQSMIHIQKRIAGIALARLTLNAPYADLRLS